MTTPPAATDRELQDQVLRALDFDPLDRASIGVTVSNGVVTLQGRVRSRREAWIAEQVVYAVAGIRGIANELHVDPDQESVEPDAVIAEAAVNALAWYRAASPETVKVIVSNGYITLAGVVADLQQRGAAERAVRGLRGVRGVWNALKIGQGPDVAMPAVCCVVNPRPM